MFCDRCGAQLSANQGFCSNCGKPVNPGAAPYPAAVSSAAPVAPQARVLQHAKVLGILWLVYSFLHLLPGLFILGFSHTMHHFVPTDVPFFVPGILHLVGLVLSIGAVLGAIAGWGLLTWQSWARMLTIVMAILQLLSFPFGTALGIYSLWVLLPSESERQYRQQSAVAAM